MSTDTIYSNAYPSEGNATTSETAVTFPHKVRTFMLINDGPSDISYRFKTTLPQSTLKSGEVVVLDMRQRQVYLQAASGTPAYRIQTTG